MERRSFIAAATLAAISTQANTANQDPHPVWFAEYLDADEQCNASVFDICHAKGEALWAERERLCLLLAQTKATTVEGLASQFEWFRHDLGYVVEGMVGEPYAGVMGLIEEGFKEIK